MIDVLYCIQLETASKSMQRKCDGLGAAMSFLLCTKWLVAACAWLAMLSAIAGAQTPSIQISSTVPADIPGGAQAADLTQAAVFAWQEFIALNWPAKAGTRDTADTAQYFGQNGTGGGPPLVWETQRGKVEIFPGNGNETTGPHGAIISQPNTATNKPLYGYNDPPAYIYNHNAVGTTDGSVAA